MTSAGCIILGLHMGRREVDVPGCGVDVGVAEQRLHHGQVHPGLGQRRPERVSKCVRCAGAHAADATVVAEDRAQARGCQRASSGWALGLDEQRTGAGIGPLGVPELLIIAFVVVLIFGVGRLPEVGGALGKGIREFRKSTKDDDDAPGDSTVSTQTDADVPPAGVTTESVDTVFCGECGTKNARSIKFCSSCGHAIGAAVG